MNLIDRSKLFIKNNSATILTCVGAAGVVGTAVLAAKATPKAIQLLKHAEEEKGERLTTLETVKAAGGVYIPALLVGASTIACIFGANALNKQHQANLMSAYALLDNSYKEYKKKVKELYGDDAEQKIREAIARDAYEEGLYDSKQTLFFDYYSGRYFESTTEKVQRAEYVVNRFLAMRDYAYLNEFYEEIGLDPIDGGYDLGWSIGQCLDMYWKNWIDFQHETTIMDDGLECIIITMDGEPVLNFGDYC